MNTDSERTLLVLGNGFDLAQGYNTKYSDFVNSVYFCDLKKSKNGFALYLDKKKIYSERWVDLEKELEEYSIHLKNDQYERSRNFINDYKDLCKNLTLFINTALERPVIATLTIHDRIYKWKKENKNIDIINLNYTPNCNFLFNEKEIRKFHVHGQTQTGIVLGVDENALNRINKDHTFLIKSRQKGYKVGELQKVIAYASKIIIFGCSLGETDYWYYKQLFSQKESKQYEIYYHGDDELTRIKDQIHHIYGSCSDFEAYHHVEYIDSSESLVLYGLNKFAQNQHSR